MVTKRHSEALNEYSKKPRLSQAAHSPLALSYSSDDDDTSVTPTATSLNEISNAESSVTSDTTSQRPRKHLCEYEGCNKAFDRPIRLETHVRSHTNERPFVCEQKGCKKTFPRVEHLRAHTRTRHSDEKEYVCDYMIVVQGRIQPCAKRFHTGTRLRRHLAAHEDKESTTCDHPGCGKVFRKQDTLQRHIMVDHLHEKPFRCRHPAIRPEPDADQGECAQLFVTAVQLKRHETREHQGKRYFCEICALQRPGATNINTSATSLDGFGTYAELQAHQKAVHAPKCSQCGKTCQSNRALNAHIDIEHNTLSARQTFVCTWKNCERKFTRKGNLNVHVQTVHIKARDFRCGETKLGSSKKIVGWDGIGCGMKLSTKASLEEHVRTQHLHLPGTIKPCREKKRMQKTLGNGNVRLREDCCDAINLLTGAGYEDRPIACPVPGCQVRFVRYQYLGMHLELTHDWQVDHIEEAIDNLAEAQALRGGQFWVGGVDSAALPAERKSLATPEIALGQRLKNALDFEQRTSEGLRTAGSDSAYAAQAKSLHRASETPYQRLQGIERQ